MDSESENEDEDENQNDEEHRHPPNVVEVFSSESGNYPIP